VALSRSRRKKEIIAPGCTRVQFLVAYDGTTLAGWQSQAEGGTVQDHLEKAFAAVAGKKIGIQGAGRTDAGVHALAQSAHVDLPLGRLSLAQWRHAVNAHLPHIIRVTEMIEKSAWFHARFTAQSKAYRYRIFHAPWLDPLEIDRAWHVPKEVDWARVEEAAKVLQGRHDFRAFCANRGWPESSTVREVWSIRLKRRGHVVTLDFAGEGFLYKMVRLLTGTLLRVGQGKATLEDVQRWLHDPQSEKTTFCAPACGLYLVKVGYARRAKSV